MSDAAISDARQDAVVGRLLAAARDTMREVRYCWVATPAAEGGANARVVLDQPGDVGDDAWTRWFLARRASRKVAELRRSGRATLAYQHDSGNAYVMLAGPAELIDERAAVETRLRTVDDPTGLI